MYEVLWLQSVVDELFELARKDRKQTQRILTTVRTFGRDGHGDIKKLQGRQENVWRLRAGDWRVLLLLDSNRAFVTRIADRRDVFQR